MEFLRVMIKSSGWLFGGAMLLCGLVALVLCAWASWQRSGRTRRAAMIASLTPLLLGFIAVPVGMVFLWLASRDGKDYTGDWPQLGYVVLFGLTISAVPMMWSALLRRRLAS